MVSLIHLTGSMGIFSPLLPTISVTLVEEDGTKNIDRYCRHKVVPGLDGVFCEKCRIWYADLATIKSIKERKSSFAESTRDADTTKEKKKQSLKV